MSYYRTKEQRRILNENTAQRVENAARNALRDMMSKYDIAEFQAQLHAAEMVDVVVGFARDTTLPPAFRKECALDVLDRAYGKVTTKTQIDMRASVSVHNDPVAQDIAKATEQSSLYLKISHYLGSGTPYDLWPEDVREAVGDMSDAFAQIDGEAVEVAVDTVPPAT